jgi:hypothetical protein
MKILTLTLLALFNIYAQSIDLENIKADSVKDFLTTHEELSQLEPSCTGIEYNFGEPLEPVCDDFTIEGKIFTNEDFRFHTKTYILNFTKEDFFNGLTTFAPSEIWSGTSKFQAKYNMETTDINYASDESTIKINDIVFLDLKVILIKKLITKNIPVGFVVKNLDREKGIVAFSYLKQNESKGVQYLKVKDIEGGMVEIKHDTRYLSGKSFRDKHLYGRFHEKLMDDFYENLETLIQSKKE